MEHPGSGFLEFCFRLEDASGSFAAHCDAISKAGVNIVTAAGLVWDGEYPIAALVINAKDADAVRNALGSMGVRYRESELHGVEVRNTPGGLAEATKDLATRDWNLRSIYMWRGREEDSSILMGATKHEE